MAWSIDLTADDAKEMTNESKRAGPSLFSGSGQETLQDWMALNRNGMESDPAADYIPFPSLERRFINTISEEDGAASVSGPKESKHRQLGVPLPPTPPRKKDPQLRCVKPGCREMPSEFSSCKSGRSYCEAHGQQLNAAMYLEATRQVTKRHLVSELAWVFEGRKLRHI